MSPSSYQYLQTSLPSFQTVISLPLRHELEVDVGAAQVEDHLRGKAEQPGVSVGGERSFFFNNILFVVYYLLKISLRIKSLAIVITSSHRSLSQRLFSDTLVRPFG